MLENFKAYLTQHGYSQETPSGHPSTVYDYAKRVNQICEREGITLNQLASDIDNYVEKYGATGSESEYGKQSHSAYINALKRFQEFLQQ